MALAYFFFFLSFFYIFLLVFLSDFGFEVPDKFLVGYALDYNEYFRDLNVRTLELYQHMTDLLKGMFIS